MLKSWTLFTLFAGCIGVTALAQVPAPPAAPAGDAAQRADRGPPPNAYSDCKGKKAGDTVQHQTPEGIVPAKCADSPKGLVARPLNPPKDRASKSPPG